jgi:hypothetical protein
VPERAGHVLSRQASRRAPSAAPISSPGQEEDTTLYDEVTEDQYKSIVKGRLQKDDFVVDDGVAGYMDNGMDDWVDGDEESSDDQVQKASKCMRELFMPD